MGINLKDAVIDMNDPLTHDVEFDGQKYTFAPGQRRSFLDDGVAKSLASYSTSDRVFEDGGTYGSTEGYSRF